MGTSWLKAYDTAVANVNAMLARRKDDELLADALLGSRDALLDAIAISTRNVAELERKQRISGLSRSGRSRPVAVRTRDERRLPDRLRLLGLPAPEIKRLKAMFQKPWTSNDRPSNEEWTQPSRGQ